MTYKTEKTEPISKHDYFRTISDCLDKLEITQSNSETSSAPNTSSKQQAIEIEKFFAAHKVSISVVNINVGPVHTRFEIKPGPGVRIKRIKDFILRNR